MSDNYIVINGKRAELTEEQLKALGIEVEKKRKNPFDRVSKSDFYYYIDVFDEIHGFSDNGECDDDESFNCVNYFNDKQFAYQVALHQQLYRKLLKFAYDNELEDTQEWNGVNLHWCIYYDNNRNIFGAECYNVIQHSHIYFSTREGASRAINEVVEPFTKEHPDFEW